MIRFGLIPLVLASCAATVESANMTAPFEQAAGSAAPFASKETALWANYTRVAPNIGTAGRPEGGGIAAAKAAGFETIIDLRAMDEEGVASDAEAAGEVGIARISMPMPAEPSSIGPFMDDLAPLLMDEARYPILLHCGSANRAGAAWALFRARSGVPVSVAIEEGRAAGMTSRESLVRDVLNQGG